MARKTWMQTFGWTTLAVITCASESCLAAGNSPYFTSYSPLIQWVDLDQGQRSLHLTGTAVDPDVTDTVRFIPSFLPSFMTFQSIQGNPGQFNVTANDLNASHIGSYFFDVVVVDSSLPTQGSSLSYAVGIVPEPSGLALVAIVALPRKRR